MSMFNAVPSKFHENFICLNLLKGVLGVYLVRHIRFGLLSVLIAITLFYSLFSTRIEAQGGNTYYVSPTGSNSNPGTRDKPWATPGYASRQLKPGDTLIILGGRYTLSQYDDDIIIPPSGTANAWITIKGEEGNRPVLAGSENLVTAIDLSGKSYIKIENLEITSDNGALFRDGIEALGGPVNHVILKDLYIHHVDEFGINIADANDLQIINCSITYCGFGSIGGPEGQQGGWRNVVIRECYLAYAGHYYQGGPGPGPYDRPDGFGIEPSLGPIEISYCLVEHNRGDGIDSKAENTHVYNCIIANNFADGVKLWGDGSKIENCLIYGRGDGDTQTTPWSPIVISTEKKNARFEILSVTVDDFVGNNYLMHVQYDYPTTAVTLVVRNTIFCGRGPESPIFIAGSVKLTMEHNLFYMPNSAFVLVYGDETYDSSQIEQLGAGNIYGDPLFVSPAFGTQGDYHLQAGSPAIDAGTSNGVPDFDLDGGKRPVGSGYDIGAYEYGSTPGEVKPPLTTFPPSPSPTGGPSLSPTPTRGPTSEPQPSGKRSMLFGLVAAIVIIAILASVFLIKRGPTKQREISSVDERIRKLDEALREGRISEETYWELRRKYEKGKK